MTHPQVTHRPKAEWPEAQAAQVHTNATAVGHDDALNVWHLIRDQLFGNVDKMEDLAETWGHNKTMTASKANIDDALADLAGYWEGGGFNSYRTYSGNIANLLATNERVMNDISDVMAECIKLVYETYGDAIDLISKCAHALAEFGLEHLFPVAGQVVKVWRTLNDFVRAWNELFAESLRKMGQLTKGGVALKRLAADFEGLTKPGSGEPRDMPGPAGDPDRWDVTPA